MDTISQVRNDKGRRYLTTMRKKQPVPFSQKFPNADPLALRLPERLLAFDPKDRPTPEEANRKVKFDHYRTDSAEGPNRPNGILTLVFQFSRIFEVLWPQQHIFGLPHHERIENKSALYFVQERKITNNPKPHSEANSHSKMR
ncbi:mitogen-activated protein kinase 20-like [Neltuma alba]|uniref:mitogen-activated protein kinase 20-like n=1 Tax=Neltuma alba TaxID=207710 RepID=UPI0010A4A4D1|nr:mitogen-activated protein kinase 20-like [Prosopis alba]